MNHICEDCGDTGFILEEEEDEDGYVRTKAKYCWCFKGQNMRIMHKRGKKEQVEDNGGVPF